MKSTWMKLMGILCTLALIICVPFIPLRAEEEEDLTPYVQYNFNNNLVDSMNHSVLTAWGSANDGSNRSNATTSYGSDPNGSYWQWHSNTARGGGFYIDIDKNIGEEYTIGIKFSFENTKGGWRKIIDYKNSTQDTGFYFYNDGHLNFYNYGVNGASVTQNDQVVDLIVRRNKNGTFEAYIVDGINKKLDLSVSDTKGDGIPAVINGKTRLGFFFDDIATTSEASPGGKVYNLKIWDKFMDVDQVIDYLLPKGDVIAHHLDEDGDKVIDDVKLRDTVGKTYAVSPVNEFGYEYVRTEGDSPTGVFPDNETKEITFIYKNLIPYSVTARYVDEEGNKLCEDIFYQGQKDLPYKVYQLEIENYDFVRVEGETEGTYTKKPKLVTFIYKKIEQPATTEEGSVRVRYMNDEGDKIHDDILYKGYINDAYQTSPLFIRGYELDHVEGNDTGVFTNQEILVTYVYSKVEEEQKGGSVIVHYKDLTGRTLVSDVVFNGNVGLAYQVEKKTIAKYMLDHILGDESGVIEEGVKEVTLIYKPLASDVLARYVDENGLTIANTEIYSGGIGESYQTEKKEIEHYRLISVEGQETGKFSQDVQVVKYIYKRISDVIVKYVDLDGNTIADDQVFTDFVGEDYEMKPLELRGYEYVRVEGNETGKYTLENQEVVYVYEKIVEGTVTIHYVNIEDGSKLMEDGLIFGRVGKPYTVDVPELHGYKLVKIEGEVNGNLIDGNLDVTIYYQLIMPDTVTARYVDENGQLLCADIVYKGLSGTAYKTYALQLYGYELVSVDGNEQGKFQKQPQLITYIYREIVEEKQEEGNVIAKYIDENGDEIHSDLIYKGIIGEAYKTNALTISNYRLKEVIGQENGLYQKDEQVITYVYEEYISDEPLGSSVIIQYKTEDERTLRYDDIFDGDIGDVYKAIRYQIDDYRFTHVEGPFYDTPTTFRAFRSMENGEEGVIEENVKIVIMYYEPLEKAASVVARYVDENGNMIHFDNTYEGFVGESYQTTQEEIEGYRLVKVEGNEKGIFENGVQIVTYVYKQEEPKKETGKVIVRYVDKDGNVIKAEDCYIGYVNEDYHLTHPEIEGYTFVNAFGETDGHYQIEDQVVVFVYERIEEEPKPDDEKNINIDIDGDGKPDINIDTDDDGKPDINIDIDGDGKPDINIDTDDDGKPDINIDIDGDGKADINIDTDGDGKPDLNIDVNGDNIPDYNIDTNDDGIADKNLLGNVNTSDSFHLVIYVGALMATAAIFMLLKKEKKKQ